jgi:hypothetical protein
MEAGVCNFSHLLNKENLAKNLGFVAQCCPLIPQWQKGGIRGIKLSANPAVPKRRELRHKVVHKSSSPKKGGSCGAKLSANPAVETMRDLWHKAVQPQIPWAEKRDSCHNKNVRKKSRGHRKRRFCGTKLSANPAVTKKMGLVVQSYLQILQMFQ